MARPIYSTERLEEERQRLIEAALALYRDRGYDAVTFRELGAATGVSYAMPYRYFESKEDLFMHIRALVFARFGDFLRSRDPRRGLPINRLHKIVMGLVEYGQSFPEDYRLIFSMRQPAAEPDSALTKVRHRVVDYVISVCQAAIDAGQMTGDASTQVQAAWASVHGLLSLHVSNQLVHGRTLEDLVEPLLDRLFAPATVNDRTLSVSPRRSSAGAKRSSKRRAAPRRGPS